ncbi:hypothetical protein SAMD00019534_103940 [Acytostelium subglobosum LB1]|uniref:hypothetical protein n=1 Tax=Acytostelium subglobosum LB1 TaxID=1410327 RepID=UPI000644BC4A|nr:hypothetical protein SAMD00019534_103940 [Acytostelium subglobosum LB1]GAM27219.1 hypothetical protein SAMD00019534_103940 [Acytostelium subglobosum LB1]|eukprot:XP_012749686.1 hypothetical protein SAMD00019534_103940 [Acytostelium subglobosum LB1]
MSNAKIEFYGCGSPNVVKVHLFFKALGVPFNYHEVKWRDGEQYKPEFVKINPNSKLPAIVDHDVAGGPITVFESGNILLYLANKYGKFIPNVQTDLQGHTEVMNWLFWQMANLGPIFGNWYHFSVYAPEKYQYSITRFTNELSRLFHVLNRTLETRHFVAGNEYTIADMAIFPWARIYNFVPGCTKEEFPNLDAYITRIKQIKSVQEFEAYEAEQNAKNPRTEPTEEQRKNMFGVDGRNTK